MRAFLSPPLYIPGEIEEYEGGIKLSLIGGMKDGTQAGIDLLLTAQWTVDDPSIAEISNGLLKPKKQGIVHVTARINDITATATVIIRNINLQSITPSKQLAVIPRGSIINVTK